MKEEPEDRGYENREEGGDMAGNWEMARVKVEGEDRKPRLENREDSQEEGPPGEFSQNGEDENGGH